MEEKAGAANFEAALVDAAICREDIVIPEALGMQGRHLQWYSKLSTQDPRGIGVETPVNLKRDGDSGDH